MIQLPLADITEISINLLLVAQVIVTVLLLVVVLMQRPKQEGLGAAFGSAITDQAFGARTTDVLKKATVWLGSLFMILCLVLGILMTRQYKANLPSLSQVAKAPAAAPAKTEQPKSVVDMLKEQKKDVPVIPATPLTPATPKK
ncbi:MAG: preprotein translocase subunit SecG [Akkermansia sp.]